MLVALTTAIRQRQHVAGLIHQSDHGCQHTSLAFEQRPHADGLPSMGRGGTASDNAVAEAFFASLNVELLHWQTWPSRAAVRLAIFDYIEIWHNRRRRHSTLSYVSPIDYEALARERAVA